MYYPAISADEWEWMWAPYDTAIYELVLNEIDSGDIVLEIGAGDLRLSRRIAEQAAQVFAIEINQSLVKNSAHDLPANLQVVTGDARFVPYPQTLTTAVLLMRHCSHFALYFDRLKAAGCRRLITNARWGMGVETIDLITARDSYSNLEYGWYACSCGRCGFKVGPPQALTETVIDTVWEISDCPACGAAVDMGSLPA